MFRSRRHAQETPLATGPAGHQRVGGWVRRGLDQPCPGRRTCGWAGTDVTHTDLPPTGYEVTIRYKNAGASRVQIAPEMTFSDPALIKGTRRPRPSPAASGNRATSRHQLRRRAVAVYDMTKDADGIWSYTTPLPSGTFSYAFVVNCASDTGAGCTRIPDPGQPQLEPGRHRRREPQVHVPSDRVVRDARQVLRGAGRGPTKAGKLEHRRYPSTSSAGTQASPSTCRRATTRTAPRRTRRSTSATAPVVTSTTGAPAAWPATSSTTRSPRVGCSPQWS